MTNDEFDILFNALEALRRVEASMSINPSKSKISVYAANKLYMVNNFAIRESSIENYSEERMLEVLDLLICCKGWLRIALPALYEGKGKRFLKENIEEFDASLDEVMNLCLSN